MTNTVIDGPEGPQRRTRLKFVVVVGHETIIATAAVYGTWSEADAAERWAERNIKDNVEWEVIRIENHRTAQ